MITTPIHKSNFSTHCILLTEILIQLKLLFNPWIINLRITAYYLVAGYLLLHKFTVVKKCQVMIHARFFYGDV